MKTIAFLLLSAVVAFGQKLTVAPAPNPSAPGSIQPNWGLAADGNLLLSWVQPAGEGMATLQYAVRRGAGWSEARTIAAGRRFWRHPAEVPGLISLSDGTLLAHWVEKGKDSSDAEYIFVSSSRDGLHWSAPQMAHRDRGPVQHGLASMVASGPKEASLFWLQALKGEDGPVSLMRTIVGADGKEIREEDLDSDVCSCCPTSAVNTAKGLLVAYRDHTPQDIRDIGILRFENGRWSGSKILHPDKWQINACPVNAAAAAAKDNRVAIAWYTEADDMPRVQVAFSSDAGNTFGNPTLVSSRDTLGYASAALSGDGGALVSWIEEGAGSAQALVRFVSAAGAAGPAIPVAEGSRTSLGYPKLGHSSNETWIAWGDSKSGVKTAQLK
ncbi:MAG TPA: hypothetical protein VKV74_07980 [Bryobacteraceae bacterium]|nr:hypothetical protein [Bryobacteraceae bacterium]